MSAVAIFFNLTKFFNQSATHIWWLGLWLAAYVLEEDEYCATQTHGAFSMHTIRLTKNQVLCAVVLPLIKLILYA
jgi:hypothetical protein